MRTEPTSPNQWVTDSTPSFLKIHQGKVISAVALAILSSGGLLFYFQVLTTASYALMGTAGALSIGNIIRSIRNSQGTYKVVSWNTGQWKDFVNMYTLNLLIRRKSGVEAESVLRQFYADPTYYIPKGDRFGNTMELRQWKEAGEFYVLKLLADEKTDQEIENAFEGFCQDPESYTQEIATFKEQMQLKRESLFKETFSSFCGLGFPDIICLQESFEIEDKKWQEELLPKGYGFFSFRSQVDGPNYPAVTNSAIAWNLAKFTLEKHVLFSFQDLYLANRAPDTIVLLRDKATQATVCAYSAYVNGFNLADFTLSDEGQKRHQLSIAEAGDKKLQYALKTMEAIHADMNIVTGDFNATYEHYKKRFNIMEEKGYITDSEAKKRATVFDANLKEADNTPKPLRLDYGFVTQSSSITDLHILDSPECNLRYFDRASDHMPIITHVVFKRSLF